MEYMLIQTEDDEHFAARTDERAPEYWAEWTAYIGELNSSGIVTYGAGLEPPGTSTTVRVRDGVRSVQDGPFAESKENLAGFFVIDVPDLDAALEWAAKCPSARYASVEVRPLLGMPPAG
jgi:hypothetical protein